MALDVPMYLFYPFNPPTSKQPHQHKPKPRNTIQFVEHNPQNVGNKPQLTIINTNSTKVAVTFVNTNSVADLIKFYCVYVNRK